MCSEGMIELEWIKQNGIKQPSPTDAKTIFKRVDGWIYHGWIRLATSESTVQS